MDQNESEDSKAPGRDLYCRALSIANSPEPNYEEVMDLLRRSMVLGNADATYALATWYLHGRDPIVRQDAQEAVRLLKIAASKGQVEALFDLAISYEIGNGTRKNLSRAFKTYLRAALRGEHGAVFEVGRMLWYGIGIRRDKKIAEIWLERSRELDVVYPEIRRLPEASRRRRRPK